MDIHKLNVVRAGLLKTDKDKLEELIRKFAKSKRIPEREYDEFRKNILIGLGEPFKKG